METVESLKAQVAALAAENFALKGQLAGYHNANCALGYQNSQLHQVGITAAQVADRNTFLEEHVVRLEKELATTLTNTERVRQEILSALRKLPKRR
jgi:regulator of replication initiation timing